MNHKKELLRGLGVNPSIKVNTKSQILGHVFPNPKIKTLGFRVQGTS